MDEDQFRFEPSYDAALGKRQIKTYHNLAKFMPHHVHCLTWKLLERYIWCSFRVEVWVLFWLDSNLQVDFQPQVFYTAGNRVSLVKWSNLRGIAAEYALFPQPALV